MRATCTTGTSRSFRPWGGRSDQDFEWLEKFLEGADPSWKAERFRAALGSYFDRILSLMRSSSRLDDLR